MIEPVYETRDQEVMAEKAAKSGNNGLRETVKTRGLIQIAHLISVERYDDARKVTDILERVKAI